MGERGEGGRREAGREGGVREGCSQSASSLPEEGRIRRQLASRLKASEEGNEIGKALTKRVRLCACEPPVRRGESQAASSVQETGHGVGESGLQRLSPLHMRCVYEKARHAHP